MSKQSLAGVARVPRRHAMAAKRPRPPPAKPPPAAKRRLAARVVPASLFTPAPKGIPHTKRDAPVLPTGKHYRCKCFR